VFFRDKFFYSLLNCPIEERKTEIFSKNYYSWQSVEVQLIGCSTHSPGGKGVGCAGLACNAYPERQAVHCVVEGPWHREQLSAQI
jgi:hypothetical protein